MPRRYPWQPGLAAMSDDTQIQNGYCRYCMCYKASVNDLYFFTRLSISLEVHYSNKPYMNPQNEFSDKNEITIPDLS